MTRIKLSAVILAAMAAVSVWSGIWVNSRCRRLIREIKRVGYCVCEGVDAGKAAAELENDWEDFRRHASMLVRSNKLSDLDRAYAGLEYRISGDTGELLACLAELSHMTGLLADGETPMLRSIL